MYEKEISEAIRLLTLAEDYKLTTKSDYIKELKEVVKNPAKLKSVYDYPHLIIEAQKSIFNEGFEKLQLLLARVIELDKEKLALNMSIRVVLGEYLDRFKKLGKQAPTESNMKEIRKLLNSLRYLVQVILDIAEKKR